MFSGHPDHVRHVLVTRHQTTPKPVLARHTHLRYLPQQPIELECRVNLRTRHNLMMMPEPHPSQ